jgi:hypothetical protein
MGSPFSIGPDTELGPAPWSRIQRVGAGTFALALLASLPLLVHPWWDVRNDSAMYVATARSLAAGEGYRYLGEPFTVRPPGFALLLAPFVGSESAFRHLNALVSLFGAAGVFMLFLFQRTRLPWPLALGVSACVWLNPGYQRLCNQVMSDVPAATLLLGCLLIHRWSERAPSLRRELALGAAIGLAAYVRVTLVLLVPAIWAARILRRALGRRGPALRAFAPRRLCLLAAVAFLVQAPWILRDAAVQPSGAVDQTRWYAHWTGLLHEDEGDPESRRLGPGEILQRVPAQSAAIAEGLGSRLHVPKRELSARVAGAALIAGLVVVLIRRRAAAEFYAAALLCVVAVYADYQDRLVLPVYLLALPASVDTLLALARRVLPRPAAAATIGAALVLLIAADVSPRRGWDAIERRHRHWVAIAAELQAALPPGAVLATAKGFHLTVYLERPVYSLLFAVWRVGDPEVVEELIERYGIDTVILTPGLRDDAPLVPYFLSRYGEPRRIGPCLLFSVRTR